MPLFAPRRKEAKSSRPKGGGNSIRILGGDAVLSLMYRSRFALGVHDWAAASFHVCGDLEP